MISFASIPTVFSSADLTTYDFGNVTVPSDGLVVAIPIGRSGGSVTVNSVSLGGSAGTLVVASGAGGTPSAIYTRSLSAGSHNVTVTFSGGCVRAACGLWVISGYASATPIDTFALPATSTGGSAGFTLDFPADGFALYGVGHFTDEAINWSAATEDDEDAVEATMRFAYAHKTATGDANTETASWATSNAYGGAAAVWAPAENIYPYVQVI